MTTNPHARADEVLADIDDVLGETIDGSSSDWSVGPDAMRWSPEDLRAAGDRRAAAPMAQYCIGDDGIVRGFERPRFVSWHVPDPPDLEVRFRAALPRLRRAAAFERTRVEQMALAYSRAADRALVAWLEHLRRAWPILARALVEHQHRTGTCDPSSCRTHQESRMRAAYDRRRRARSRRTR